MTVVLSLLPVIALVFGGPEVSAAIPQAGAAATEEHALTGGRPTRATLQALEVRMAGATEIWRFRFRTFGDAKGGLPEFQVRFEERQESVGTDEAPMTRRPGRLVLLVRRLRRVVPTLDAWSEPAAKSDWIEKVRLWPALDGDDRAFEFELRQGGTHKVVASGDTLELRFSPAPTLR